MNSPLKANLCVFFQKIETQSQVFSHLTAAQKKNSVLDKKTTFLIFHGSYRIVFAEKLGKKNFQKKTVFLIYQKNKK